MKKELKISIVILGIVLIIIGGFLVYQSTFKKTNNENITVNMDEKQKVKEFLSYSGIYKNKDITLVLNASSSQYITLSYTKDNNTYMIDLSLKDNSLTYNGSYGLNDEKINILITKTSAGIKVTSESSESTSRYNKISGDYKKESFKSNEWSGYYINGNTKLIIDEYSKDNIIFLIEKNSSTYSKKIKNNSPKILSYEDIFLDEKETITIEKNKNNTIKVTGFSSLGTSLLNEISGIYTKSN